MQYDPHPYIKGTFGHRYALGGSPGGSDCKECTSLQKNWVRSLDWEEPLEEGMATHSSILAWRIPWTEEPNGLHSMGSQRVGRD